MEILKLKIINEDDYKKFLSKIEKFKEILKENKKYESIYTTIDSANKKSIYFYLLLFQNYEKWINFFFDNNYNINDIHKYILIKKFFQKVNPNNENNKNLNLHSLLIIWLFYLYDEFAEYFYEFQIPNYSELNRIRYILRETNNLMVKLYKEGIINTSLIFNVIDFYLFLIETNYDVKSYSDKLYKAKNSLLLQGLFFIIQEISVVILNKVNLNKEKDENENKENVQKIFSFLEELKNNIEINTQLNINVLVNNNLIHNLMTRILGKIDINIMEKIEPEFKNKLLNFFSHFLKFNYKKSKIFNSIINALKQSFINLYNFENNKSKIIHDFFENNFYIKLLKKIFYFDENSNNKICRPLFDTFYFNGFDSQISLNVQQTNNAFDNKKPLYVFEKSTLFFSFYLCPLKGRKQYPLFIIQKDFDNKKTDLLHLYIKQTENNYEEFELYIYIEGKETKLDKLPKIKKHTTYYFSLCFNMDKLIISFCNKKEEIFSTEIAKNSKLLAINSISFSFGFYKKKVNVFSGHFGPIIILKNPKNSKESIKFINSVLKLEKNYINYIFLNDNSNFLAENDIYLKNNKINELDYNLEEIEFLLYLMPDNFRFFSEKSRVVNHLPNIDGICKYQRKYNIYNLNVSLIKHEQGIINFLMDNGLNYICLLYEYIYQFAENYTREEIQENNEIDEYKDILIKMIVSIIKKTLFILEKNYNEINLINFKKPLKQIYMNLFTIINIISPKNCIIEDLIDSIFCIIKNYHNFISNFIKKKKLFTKDSIKLRSNEFNNNNELQINLCFMNGWIDFLLNPQIYDLKKQDTLKKLFIELSIFLNYIKLNKESEKINQTLFLKLLNFIPFLNIFYNQNNLDTNIVKENINNNDIKDKSQINKSENEKDIFDLYFYTLKTFFESIPSKSEIMDNFKKIFIFINENISQNSQIAYKFYNFLDESYFYDDKDDEQIKLFLKYTFKFSQNVNENLEAKNEKEINNKRNLFNKLFSLVIRLIYNRQRIGRNDKILDKFKKKMLTVEKTKDLLIIVSNEIINIFNNIFLKKNIIKKEEENQSKKDNKKVSYEKEELNNLSNFYYSIFDLILFFLEYPIDNNDKMIVKIINFEEIIADLLSKITNILKSILENNNKFDNNNNNVINSEENDKYLDIIYSLINYLKFYDIIFFQKTYSEKFLQNFIDVCELCFKCSLIYSNILIEIDENSCIEKVPLEIILDICIFYISLTSSKYCENLSENEISKDSIIEEQRMIFNFLNKLLYPNSNKDSKNKNTIFFINDYIRYLSYVIDTKKRPKKEPFYSEYLKEINMYQFIDKLLSNEKKYTCNFSTFFILKCNGYKKILFELIVKVLLVNPQAKDFLKFDDILTLMIGVIQQNYIEHEILYEKNKSFFFNSKKVSTSYDNYNIIKKKIESYLKKNNYSEIDDYILNNIVSKDFDNIYTLIYSGLCISKSKDKYKLSFGENEESKQIKYIRRHALSSTNVIKQVYNEMNRTFSDKKKPRKLTKSINEPLFERNGSSEKESSITQDEYEYSLQVEETPSSDINNNKSNNNIEENLKIDLDIKNTYSNYSSPLNNDYKKLRKQTFNSAFSLGDNLELSDKKSQNLRNFSILSEMSIDSNDGQIFTYLNYFNEPDECYIKNPKKELMMTIFSIYFYDTFFNNENFKLMKNYYFQNFDKIQISTKLLDYPTKIKYFNNGLEPNLFLKPFPSFFTNKIFPITHKYFHDYMKEKNIKEYEPIILFKKILPEIYLEEKFDIKCELIKINHCYYGHMISSKNAKYLIFEQQKYTFYDELSDPNKNKELNLIQLNNHDLNELFTLSNISKKPFNKMRKNSLSVNDEDKNRKKYKRNKTLVILFHEIDEIIDRRFLLMWQAIEIYLKNGKSYFFNLLSREQHNFILDIFKNNAITKNKIHIKDSFKAHIKRLTTEWQEERLSTYEYLLFLNKYGTRTFNDVNQYPIFPWLVRKFELDSNNKFIETKYRDFKYPMAAQIEENRVNAFNRFEDDEQSKIKFPVHYGTHYSTSSYIYFYLMREEPFTTLLVKLQGYKQENPDRMFFSLIDTLFVLETGSDNREAIPDIFCKIEQFINLNCADFGKKNNGNKVDDFIIFKDRNTLFIDDNNDNNINYYVEFIIENKKLLDNKKISSKINDWFDIIFGIGQLPEKNMKKCLNIFNKETYEQKTNLHEKLLKLQKKCKKEEDIIKKIENKIDLIISFGQTPYQLFNEKHPKNEKDKKSKESIENDDDDFETFLENYVWEKNIKGYIETLPIFFEINPSLGKVFLIDKNRVLQIIDSNYYNSDEEFKKHFYLKSLVAYKLPHIKFFEKLKIQDISKNFYYINKPKYCFSSFNEKEISNNNELDDTGFSSYYNLYINNICNKQDSKKGKSTNKIEYIRFITCRYMDNSFKIHNIIKKKPQKDDNPISIICEDFVSACCTLNHNKFFVGLKNGKLIQWSIKNEVNEFNLSKDINFKIDKKIQAHKNAITVIEINIRLGIIITAGEDNYVFIRKIYDLELITPIKLKTKYIITMARISPMNFLYIMCFNKKKKKNKSKILGYTLNGLLFAKSKYGYYDSIDFTKNGNIVSFGSKKEIVFLYGNNLKNIAVNKDDKELNEVQNKIAGASWIKYNYFYRKHDIGQFINKILTYTIFDKSKGNLIQTLDVSKIKYFD